jgi:hypothetical protein
MADLVLNPCEACVAQAAYSKLLINGTTANWTASGGAKRLHFLGEGLRKYVKKRNDQGITGDLWKLASRIHDGQSFVYGPIYFAMNAGDTEVLLPYILGAKDSGTGGSGDYEPSSCATAANFLILRDYGIFEYEDCYAASWRIDSRALQFQEDSLADMVVLAVNWIGTERNIYTDESDWPVADEPELGMTAAYAPYFFKHSTLTLLDSVDYGDWCKQVQLSVDRKLQPRYRMSVAPTGICSYGRDVNLEVSLDWNSTTKNLLEQATVKAGSVKFSSDEDGTYYTQFNFAALIADDEDPVSPNKESDVEFIVKNTAAADDPTAGEYDISATNLSV